MLAQAIDPRDDLISLLAYLADKPYEFVIAAFPWGEKGGELEGRDGPDIWQAKLLQDIQFKLQSGHLTAVGAIREATKSGHGVGKSAVVSWLCWWAISTAVGTRGRVTANTEKQLRTVLWAELMKWHQLFIGRELFRCTATAIYSADPMQEKTWRIDAVPWSDENPEAFAGLHNYGKRLIYIFDEASAIPDKIWEVVDGAMTDANTELLWIATGNPTRNYGRFHDCFNEGSGWSTRTVNSEDSAFSNKAELQNWCDRWGWDSDFYRVRVRGEFPNASELQLIPVEAIRFARARQAVSWPGEAKILAVDIARFGNNESVAIFSVGKDARTIEGSRWRGLSVPESAARIAGLISRDAPDAVFIDEGGVGGGVVDNVRLLGHSCIGVNFGAAASSHPGGTRVANKRAEMYVAMRDWLREGGAIPDDQELEDQLVSIDYHFNKKTEIQLMAKEDMRSLGRPSPDWADALAMTFAYPVSAKRWKGAAAMKFEYNPYSLDALREPQSEVIH